MQQTNYFVLMNCLLIFEIGNFIHAAAGWIQNFQFQMLAPALIAHAIGVHVLPQGVVGQTVRMTSSSVCDAN